MFNIQLTSGLNMISAWWHMVGVVLVVGILIIVPDQHQSLSYVFTETVNNSGYGGGTTSFSNPAFWFVFGLGLLMSQYTITGFDASAHTAEETQQRVTDGRNRVCGRRSSSRSSSAGSCSLAVTFAVPDTQSTIDTANALLPIVPFIWVQSMSQNWAELLLFICVVAQFFCVTASTTSASRMIFAFSRDRAVPGHQLWRRVAKNRVPRWSVLFVAFWCGILMVPAIWNYFIGYAVGTAIAVIGLYIAFIIPVYLRWRKGDSWDEPRAWSLGRHYKWLDVVSILWVALITILFIFPLYTVGLPWNNPFDWQFTNYTVLWFAGIGLIFGGWWALSAKNWFTGPVRMGTRGRAGTAGSRTGRTSSRFRPKRRRADHSWLRGAPEGAPRRFSPRVQRRRTATPPSGGVARNARWRRRRSRSRAPRPPTARRPTSPRGSRT